MNSSFSPSYISSIVIIITSVVQFSSIDWSSADVITPIVTAVVTLIAGTVIAYRKYKSGEVTLSGARK